MDMFIEKVRLNPCLWDTGHISYRDIGKKDMVWDRIAMECGMDNGREAKCQFKKLRDSHREALRRRKYAPGSTAQNMKPWRYEAQMSFLLPQPENTPSISLYIENAEDMHDTSTHFMTETTDNIDTEASLPLEVSLATPTDADNRKRKRLGEVTEIAQDKRREQRQFQRDELRRQAMDMSRPQDALTTLFDSMCQKTRELPKHLQLRVQREIFESVTRAEEEALDPISTYFSPTSSTSNYEYANARSQQASPGVSTATQPATASDVKSEKIDRCYLE